MLNREIYDFTSTSGRPFRVVFEPAQPGVRFHEEPIVKFYDRTYDFTPDGQFTGGSYYVETLASHPRGAGLMLQGGEPAWNLSGTDMIAVLDAMQVWLNETRAYLVGVPVVVTVDKHGTVTLTLDAVEITDRHFAEDDDTFDEETVEYDRQRIERAIRNRTATITYN